MVSSTSTTPRKRPHPRSRRRAYLLVGFLAAVVVGPRSVVGFGFSSIRTACLSGVRPAVSGALSTAASAVSLERVDRHQEADWRRRAAARREGREAHAITCKIAPPRKYGSAVSFFVFFTSTQVSGVFFLFCKFCTKLYSTINNVFAGDLSIVLFLLYFFLLYCFYVKTTGISKNLLEASSGVGKWEMPGNDTYMDS